MRKLTDYSQTVKMNKAQLISFIYDLCDEYFKTNVNENSGDISYNLGVKDTVEGLRNYIRININEMPCNSRMVSEREIKGEIETFCQNKITSITNTTIAEKEEEILQLDNPVDIKE